VSQPSAVTGIAKLVAAAPIGVLQDQLILRSLDGYADVLPKAAADTLVKNVLAAMGKRIDTLEWMAPDQGQGTCEDRRLHP
jgi:hypothetical protein